MSSEENPNGEADKVIALLPWDIAVRRAKTRKQAHEIVERKDADEAIRALTELETYYVVKELGLEDSVPALAVIDAPQIRALFDLDVWRDDRADPGDLFQWFAAFREAGPEALARAAKSIDPELLALALRRRLWISHAKESDDVEAWVEDPPESILPLMETPDRRFVLAARTVDELGDEHDKPLDEEERKLVLDLVEQLYRDEDHQFMAWVLRLAVDDLSSALEEEAHRFRVGRLEDLGFPARDRALSIYGPVDPSEALARPDPVLPATEMLLPELHTSRLSRGLFHEAMRRVHSPEAVRRIEGDLVALANSALVADRVEPGDLERVAEVLDRMRAYLELALAYGVEPAERLEVARERLETHGVRTLFRAGYSVTLELATRARRLAEGGAFRAGEETLALLADRDRAVLEALSQARPRFARVLEHPARSLEDTRPFASPDDVAAVASALRELEGLAAASATLGLVARNDSLTGPLDPPLAAERTIDMLLATGAANVLLHDRFEVEPLGAADLGRLRGFLGPTDRQFPAAMLARAIERATAAGGDRAVEGRVREGLVALADALSLLMGQGEIDPRFVGIVVRRVD